jgi:chorismate mutase/prephenate dehydratase
MNLVDLRTEIDAIDDAMVQLFIQRMTVVKKVADFKKAHDLPTLDRSRELAKLRSLPADWQPYIGDFYEQIFELSRNYQDGSKWENSDF